MSLDDLDSITSCSLVHLIMLGASWNKHIACINWSSRETTSQKVDGCSISDESQRDEASSSSVSKDKSDEVGTTCK